MRMLVLMTMVLGAFAAFADDSYLYWMVDTDDGTAGEISYDSVRVRAFETDGGVDKGYLTLYYGNGAAVGGDYPNSVGKDLATAGLPFYASLASVAGSSFSYVVELFNDGALVGQSESLLFTDAMAQNYVATVTSTGTFPAMASWAAGGYSSVPEPNSALLIVLGCAALALRRKCARRPLDLRPGGTGGPDFDWIAGDGMRE